MEIDYRKLLVIDCMKTKFEEKVCKKLDENLSLEEIDRWLDPQIRTYFSELDLVLRYYEPEKFEDDERFLITDEDITAEKSGILNQCEKIRSSMKAEDILESCSSLEEADKKLEKLLTWRKKQHKAITSFYGIDI